MDASNVVFSLQVLGIRREQEDCWGRQGRSRMETGCRREHGYVPHYLNLNHMADHDDILAGGIAGLVGNPGGTSDINRVPVDVLLKVMCIFDRNRYGPTTRRLC